jgi:hypothetical protein
MVQDGNITAKDAIRHAEALNSIKVCLSFASCLFVSRVQVRKKGDAQRILLMNMVKVRPHMCHCVSLSCHRRAT